MLVSTNIMQNLLKEANPICFGALLSKQAENSQKQCTLEKVFTLGFLAPQALVHRGFLGVGWSSLLTFGDCPGVRLPGLAWPGGLVTWKFWVGAVSVLSAIVGWCWVRGQGP